MMSSLSTTATTPMVVPPCVLRFAEIDVLRGGVVVGGLESCSRWTRGGSANAPKTALASFFRASKQDHGSSIEDNGGGLRTRVEVTDRQ